MDSRERRRPPASPARLTLLLLANGVCLFVLWCAFRPLLDQSGDDVRAARAAPHPAVPPAALSMLVANAPEPRPRTRSRVLESQVQALVSDALAKAQELGKGKLSASNLHVSVHVREAGRGGDLVALDAQRAMRPASNEKLITTAAALCSLGAEWDFVTCFDSEARIEQGVLRGDLVVRAAGDPFYDAPVRGKPDPHGKVDSFFAKIAGQLKAAGVESVAGALVLDEGDFLEPGPGPGWPASNQYWEEFCGLAGGLNANAGCLTALVRPDKGLEDADVAIEPRWHGLKPRIDVRTSARGQLDLRVQARKGELSVQGVIPRSVPEYEVRFAAPDPVLLFGHAALGALRTQGVRIEGGLRRQRNAAPGRELARLATPLLDLLVPINTDSNNVCADQVFLALGHARGGAGTREGGARATREALQRLGVPVEGYVQVDGSGLSKDDRTSAQMITALVDAVLRLDPQVARAYVDSLAVGGATGTLEKRGLDEHVRAKTGFIAGTSALSGLVESRSGRTLIFSILVDYPPTDGLNTRCWKPMQDSICKLLAGWNAD